MILDYSDFRTAKNAVQSDRYDLEVLDDKHFVFMSKEFNEEFNIQEFLEKNNIFTPDLNIDFIIEDIGNPLSKEIIEKYILILLIATVEKIQ